MGILQMWEDGDYFFFLYNQYLSCLNSSESSQFAWSESTKKL